MRRTDYSARRLQRMLGGEYHETCFCTCWSRRAWRRCTLQRSRRLRCLSPFRARPRKLPTSSRPLTSATNGATAGTNRPTPMATVTTTRITMAVGVGIAGDTGTAGTTGTITTAAGDMADTTGISGHSEERGFGPFLFSSCLSRRQRRGQSQRDRRRDDRTTSELAGWISCLRASRSTPPAQSGPPCQAPAPIPQSAWRCCAGNRQFPPPPATPRTAPDRCRNENQNDRGKPAAAARRDSEATNRPDRSRSRSAC